MTVVAAARKRMPQMICGPHSPSVSAVEWHPLHHSLTPCCRPHYSCTTQDLSKALLDTGDAQRQGACPVAVPMAVLHWHLDHSDSQPGNICAITTEHMVAGAALHQQHNHSDSQPDSICAALMVQSPHNTCTVVLVVADGVGGSALPTHTRPCCHPNFTTQNRRSTALLAAGCTAPGNMSSGSTSRCAALAP